MSVPQDFALEPARLVEIEFGLDSSDTRPKGEPVPVQFNPESLRLSYSNTVGKTAATGTAAMQFLASASSRLDIELWLDATVHEQATDVRQLTAQIRHFVTPQAIKQSGEAKFLVPALRFTWGTFLFEGVVTSLNEVLELFSSDGRPLRAKVTLSIASQDVVARVEALEDAQQPGPGQEPRTPVATGDSLQQVAGRQGDPTSWRALAEANGVEDPRHPPAGTLFGRPGRRR
jgi:hypothetical protein